MDKKERFNTAFDYLRQCGKARTQKDVAAKMSTTEPNVSAAMKGRETVLTNSFIKRFNDAYGNIFSLEWLLDGKGEMMNTNNYLATSNENAGFYTHLLPQSALAGSLDGFGADSATLENCERVVSPIADVDFAITIYGDSMLPDYPSGTRALIKKVDPSIFIAWGNVYVLDTANGAVVKELQPSSHEGRITCHSTNPNGRYKDFEIACSDVRGIYRVLACISVK